ncbi:zinc-finger-containing protein [Dyella caseinilytica]|uniref:Uncharacterized protein n=1 Tax=Dyella caseinilytica TaxID=1849581 RepID=A0ABX7GQ01_9GAMM|nr:zinc-finger-containing protein [Dyella caseinilytica]QRN52431.1 hypothetical protein ISN74_13190 [Dyella caseinilytica]GGA05936.1 hypothetical protein GCM10011408_28590 [Dyella caseinilytica]
MSVMCGYCNQPAALVRGPAVYPHRPDLRGLQFHICRPCGAWIGCERGTTNPLGTLANAELRRARMDAHAAFDPSWKGNKRRRGERYAWLAERLGIPRAACHIGHFDLAMCRRVVDVCLIDAVRGVH